MTESTGESEGKGGQVMLSLRVNSLLTTWGREKGRKGERMKLREGVRSKMELIKEGSLEEVSFKGEVREPSL